MLKNIMFQEEESGKEMWRREEWENLYTSRCFFKFNGGITMVLSHIQYKGPKNQDGKWAEQV